MGFFVCATAQMQCTMGVAPAVLSVVRPNVLVDKKPAANIMDHQPLVNVPTFGMCNATANPAVIAATSAALGVHTPAPCVPNTTTPWAPGCAKVLLEKKPALNDSSKLNCLWSGVISVNNAGQQKVRIP